MGCAHAAVRQGAIDLALTPRFFAHAVEEGGERALGEYPFSHTLG